MHTQATDECLYFHVHAASQDDFDKFISLFENEFQSRFNTFLVYHLNLSTVLGKYTRGSPVSVLLSEDKEGLSKAKIELMLQSER